MMMRFRDLCLTPKRRLDFLGERLHSSAAKIKTRYTEEFGTLMIENRRITSGLTHGFVLLVRSC